MDKQNLTTDKNRTTDTNSTRQQKKRAKQPKKGYSFNVTNILTKCFFIKGLATVDVQITDSITEGTQFIVNEVDEEISRSGNRIQGHIILPADKIPKQVITRFEFDSKKKKRYLSEKNNSHFTYTVSTNKILRYIFRLWIIQNQSDNKIVFTIEQYAQFIGAELSKNRRENLLKELRHNLNLIAGTLITYRFTDPKTRKDKEGSFTPFYWNREQYQYIITFTDPFIEYLKGDFHLTYLPDNLFKIPNNKPNLYMVIEYLNDRYWKPRNRREATHNIISIKTLLKQTNLADTTPDNPNFRPNNRIRDPLMRILNEAKEAGLILNYHFQNENREPISILDAQQVCFSKWVNYDLVFDLPDEEVTSSESADPFKDNKKASKKIL